MLGTAIARWVFHSQFISFECAGLNLIKEHIFPKHLLHYLTPKDNSPACSPLYLSILTVISILIEKSCVHKYSCDQKCTYTHDGDKCLCNFGLLKISVSCSFSRVDYHITYIFNDFKNEELGAELCIYFGFSFKSIHTRTPINICLNGPQLVAAQPDSFVSHRQVSDIILAGYLTTLLSATFKPLISQLKVCMPHHTEFIDIQFNSIIFI